MKKYEKVIGYIKEKIDTGVYPVGSKIPTEDEFISLLNISRSPVRHALSVLLKEGWIYKIHGSGSYVKNTVNSEAIDIYAILNSESRNLETEVIQGMRAALDNSPYRNIHLILKKPGDNTLKQIEVLNMISPITKGGILCIPLIDQTRSMNRLLGANLRKFEKAGSPVILMDRYVPEYESSYVMTDHRKAAYAMVDFLISYGHERIACFYNHGEIPSVKLRLQGARECFQDHNLNTNALFKINIAEQKIEPELLNNLYQHGVTAIFGLECEITLKIYSVLRANGYTIPQDFSICSFDNHCFTSEQKNFITSVTQRLESIGYYAVQLLLDKIERKTSGNISMLVESDIKRRKSVGKN